MDTLIQDIRYGARGLLKKPGFTAIAVITLALGIGANTAIFSLLYAVLLKPLAFSDLDRLVMVWEDQSTIGFPRAEVAPGIYSQWKAEQSVFEDMGGFVWRNFTRTRDDEPEKVGVYGVTANFFSLLGVRPVIGRSPDICNSLLDVNSGGAVGLLRAG